MDTLQGALNKHPPRGKINWFKAVSLEWLDLRGNPLDGFLGNIALIQGSNVHSLWSESLSL